MDPLPPPSSGLFLEVLFRRLLASCEATVGGGAPAARAEFADGGWATSPVFHHVRGSFFCVWLTVCCVCWSWVVWIARRARVEGGGARALTVRNVASVFWGCSLTHSSPLPPIPDSTSRRCRSSWPTWRRRRPPNGECVGKEKETKTRRDRRVLRPTHPTLTHTTAPPPPS